VTNVLVPLVAVHTLVLSKPRTISEDARAWDAAPASSCDASRSSADAPQAVTNNDMAARAKE